MPVAPGPRSRLPLVAIALAGVATVLLVVAVLRRGPRLVANEGPGSAGSDADLLGAPSPDSLVDPAVVAMFVAVCHHEVGCGVGSVETCAKIEQTMRRMPRKLSYKACTPVNEDLAKQCVATLASLPSCRDFAKSLALIDLQHALDRVTPCRRACDP